MSAAGSLGSKQMPTAPGLPLHQGFVQCADFLRPLWVQYFWKQNSPRRKPETLGKMGVRESNLEASCVSLAIYPGPCGVRCGAGDWGQPQSHGLDGGPSGGPHPWLWGNPPVGKALEVVSTGLDWGVSLWNGEGVTNT